MAYPIDAMLKPAVILLAAAAIAHIAGCSDQSGGKNAPYLKIVGGSFIFNYRLAHAYAGAVVVAERELPAGATIEFAFENPAGGPPFVLTETVDPGEDRFSFTVEPLEGIKTDTDYIATVRLIGADGTELEKIEKAFRSDIDQETVMPKEPLTIGPGYTPNPEAAH